jgi:hypothetical protein
VRQNHPHKKAYNAQVKLLLDRGTDAGDDLLR